MSAFLTHLAVNRAVAASTQCQALNALVFLYRELLQIDLGQLPETMRPQRKRKAPVVLSRGEVQRLLACWRERGSGSAVAAGCVGSGLKMGMEMTADDADDADSGKVRRRMVGFGSLAKVVKALIAIRGCLSAASAKSAVSRASQVRL